MIAFVQPFGLHSPGGGARILRSLVADAPTPYCSVCTALEQPDPSPETETHLPLRLHFGWIEGTRLPSTLGFDYLAHHVSSGSFKRKLRRLCREKNVTAIHAIPHGIDFWYAFEVAQELDLPYILNVHDELSYNLRKHRILPLALDKLAHVWPRATERIVISEPMGKEYCRRYGDASYEIITDGLEDIAPEPRPRQPNSLRMYFMGLAHLSYESNFDALFETLAQLQATARYDTVSLTTRPGFSFSIEPRGVPVDERPWGTQEDIERDLETADVLYFPLPFEEKYAPFTRYSLSTKLVTYLGTGLPIFFHGPEQSAAGRLLHRNEAAAPATTLDPDQMMEAIQQLLAERSTIVNNALDLAQSRFQRKDQQRRFWSLIEKHVPASKEVSNVFR